MGLGIGELALILVIVLIIFGAAPDIGEGLGRGIRSFRKAVKMPDAIDVTEESAEKPIPNESDSKS